jgi:hypothetical protein
MICIYDIMHKMLDENIHLCYVCLTKKLKLDWETMMSASFNPHLRAAILEAVDSQIGNNNPPETRQTYERLLREGSSENDTKVLIASVVSVEIFEIVNRREPYNHERFLQALSRLPELPEA